MISMPNVWRRTLDKESHQKGRTESMPIPHSVPNTQSEPEMGNVVLQSDPLFERVVGSRTDEIFLVAELEKLAILRALRITHGNIDLSAKRLGMGRATLYRRIAQYEDVDVLSFKLCEE